MQASSHQQSAISGKNRQLFFVGGCWLLAAGCFALLSPVVWACPMCSQVLSSPGEAALAGAAIRGYAVSLIALLGIPMLLLLGLSWRIARSIRHGRRRVDTDTVRA